MTARGLKAVPNQRADRSEVTPAANHTKSGAETPRQRIDMLTVPNPALGPLLLSAATVLDDEFAGAPAQATPRFIPERLQQRLITVMHY